MKFKSYLKGALLGLFSAAMIWTQMAYALPDEDAVLALIEAHTLDTSTTTLKQLADLDAELENGKANLAKYDGSQTQWSDVQSTIEKIIKKSQEGQAIAYQGIDADNNFKNKFKGYQSSQNYSEDYKNWSQTSMDALQNNLVGAGWQADEINDEQTRLKKLKDYSQSAKGRMQAAQVGNMLASEQIGQLQKLRQLIVNQLDSQNTYMAYQIQKEQAQRSAEDDLFKNINKARPYGSGDGGFKPGL